MQVALDPIPGILVTNILPASTCRRVPLQNAKAAAPDCKRIRDFTTPMLSTAKLLAQLAFGFHSLFAAGRCALTRFRFRGRTSPVFHKSCIAYYCVLIHHEGKQIKTDASPPL